MTDFGLSDTGFVPKTQEDLRAELDDNIREIAPSLPLGDETWAGHQNGLLSILFAELWQLGQSAINSRDPNNATGARLAATAALTGTTKLAARPSRVTCYITGTPSTFVASGFGVTTGGLPSTVFSVTLPGQPQRRFHSETDTTILAAATWTVSTAYVVGDIVTNANRVYRCITAGTSAAVTGPSSANPDITDGTAHWKYLGEGSGYTTVAFVSDDLGPVVAAAGDLSLIATQLFGVGTVSNPLDATVGALEESDADLRLRREQELAAGGTAPKDALRADLLEVGASTTNPVVSVAVYPNNDDVTDADGVPPHSVECVVIGGDDQALYNQLLASVATGIRSHGTSVGTALDSEGRLQTEKFTRPAQIPIYARVVVEYDATLYPSDGNTQVKTAIETLVSSSPPGKDAVPAQLAAKALTVSGVTNADVTIYTDAIGTPVAWAATTAYTATVGSRSVVTNDGGRLYICITAGTSAGLGGPTGVGQDITDGTVHWSFIGAKIAVSSRQQAVYAAARITVVSSAVTP